MFTPFFLSRDRNVREVVCLQTDDTRYGGVAAFKELEYRLATRLLRKSPQTLGLNTSFTFNGGSAVVHRKQNISNTSRKNRSLTYSQQGKADKIAFPFVRARSACISSVSQLNPIHVFATAAQCADQTEQDYIQLNCTINIAKCNELSGLRFFYWI